MSQAEQLACSACTFLLLVSSLQDFGFLLARKHAMTAQLLRLFKFGCEGAAAVKALK